VFANYYRGIIESILNGNITNWHGMCTAQDRRALKLLIRTVKNIIGSHLLSISDMSDDMVIL